MEFEFESLIQMSSNQPILSCISQKTLILPCHDHASYCALHWLCFLSVCRCCSPSVDVVPTLWSLALMKTQCYLQKCQASNPPLSIPIQSHSLALALFYCIRTPRIQLLHAVVVEHLPSVWHAIVNSCNPLAWVGVVWAIMCLLIHACLSCLLLVRVERGLIHRGRIGTLWTGPTVGS